MKKSVKMENLYISHLLDSDVAVPCGKQFGFVDETEWASWFPKVELNNAGNPKAPNTDNLSVWSDGRGPFVDCQMTECGTFFDVKMKSKMPNFFGLKQEVWSGSPALERRESGNVMTDKEVVDMFISNENEKQIVRSLKGIDSKPYLLQFVWQEINVDGTWDWKVIGINASAYLQKRAKEKSGEDSKSGMSGLVYRVKKGSKKGDYGDSSSSARVEVKFFHTHEQMIELGVATPICNPNEIDWATIQ